MMVTDNSRFSLPLAAAFLLAFSGCAHMGNLSAFGAGVLHATGVVNANQAQAIAQTGAAVSSAYEDISPEQEYFIGRAVAANILAKYDVAPGKDALVRYLNDICNAITINSPRPNIYNGYHVNILDSDEVNAFATSGGHIFVTRGIIAGTVSEDTLAAVLAHEISHIQLNHGLDAIMRNRKNQAWATGLSSGFAALTDLPVDQAVGIFNGMIGDLVNTIINSGYSRTQEYEADANALSLMAEAGYEPSSLITMLEGLATEQGAHAGGFNDTHPTPADRIANVRDMLGQYSVPDTRQYRAARYNAVAK